MAERYKIMHEGRVKLENARRKLGIKQVDLSKKLNIHPATFNAWLCGRQTMPHEMLIRIYEELKESESVEFLKYATKDILQKDWIAYLEPNTRHGPESLFYKMTSSLNPFYQRIDEVYNNADNKERCAILIGLEKLVSKHEKK